MIGMRFGVAVLLGAALGGCGEAKTPPTAIAGDHEFSLGAMPLFYARPGELRYIVRIPRRYVIDAFLPAERTFDPAGPIYANNVKIAVHYPSLEPAAEADYGKSVRLLVGDLRERGIAQRLDGTWLNHFSIYTVELPGQHGLKLRKNPAPPPLDDVVYYRLSPEIDVSIECQTNVHDETGRWCVMAAQRPGEPYLETSFSFSDLPGWRERLERLQSLFVAEGREPYVPAKNVPAPR